MVGAGLLMLAITAAQPVGGGDWVTPYDYRAAALRDNRGGTSFFTLYVAATGKVMECTITRSSGWQDLDQLSCRLIMKRARFKPALDGSGNPMPFVYRNRTMWWAGDGRPPKFEPLSPELMLTVATLPKGVDHSAETVAALLVDSSGRASECTAVLPDPHPKSGSRAWKEAQAVIEELGATACRAALSMSMSPFHDEGGRAAASIQTMKIGFTLAE